LYDRGKWLVVSDDEKKEEANDLTMAALGKYAALDYLPRLTSIKETDFATFTEIFNELSHDPVFLQIPLYEPAAMVTDRGSGIFANEPHYHVDMAAFRLLGKWFRYLKENDVYDNTKIIIVSDHGYNISIPGMNDTKLPNKENLLKYNALLMVKDFGAKGALITDNTFMTQADVPLIVAGGGVIEKPVNPFSGSLLYADKDNGVFVTTSNKFYHTTHGKYKFNIEEDEYYLVNNNIFDTNNWKKVGK
jgi:hypothetical protein